MPNDSRKMFDDVVRGRTRLRGRLRVVIKKKKKYYAVESKTSLNFKFFTRTVRVRNARDLNRLKASFYEHGFCPGVVRAVTKKKKFSRNVFYAVS